MGRYLIYYADNRVKVCETCINRSCSKMETLLRRTNAFGPVCFLYASLLRISKAKTVKGTLLQTFFSPQIKNPPALRGHKQAFLEFLRNRELHWTFLSIFSKRNIFLHFKTIKMFFISFCSFEGVRYFCMFRTLYRTLNVSASIICFAYEFFFILVSFLGNPL